MNQTQINELEMMVVTNSYLDTHTAVWSSIPIVGKYKTSLMETVSAIKEAAKGQELARVFLSESQINIKRDLAIKMDLLDDILEAYAADTEDAELLSKAANTYSDYFRLTNEEFEVKVQNMIALLEEKAPKVVSYGLTAEQIDDAKLTYNNFAEQRGKPRAYQVASRIATGSMGEHIAGAKRLLERLDKVLTRFKRSNTAFYTGYSAARMIVKN